MSQRRPPAAGSRGLHCSSIWRNLPSRIGVGGDVPDGCKEGAVPENVVPGDPHVVGGARPGQIHLVMAHRGGRKTRRSGGGLGVGGRRGGGGGRVGEVGEVGGGVFRPHPVGVGSGRRHRGVGVGSPRSNALEEGAVPEDLVPGDPHVVGGGGPGQIHLVMAHRGGRKTRRSGGGLGVGGRRGGGGGRVGEVGEVGGGVFRPHPVGVGSGRRHRGVGVGSHRSNALEEGAVAEDLVPGDSHVVGGPAPGQIHLVMAHRGGRKTRRGGGGLGVGGRRGGGGGRGGEGGDVSGGVFRPHP